MKRTATVVLMLSVVILTAGSVNAYVLDQVQDLPGGQASVQGAYDLSLGQTFTAGVSEILGAIDIGVSSVRTAGAINVLISNIVAGAPSVDPAQVLGSVTVPGDQWAVGWNRIPFENEAVALIAGEQYAIVLEPGQSSTSVQVQMLTVNNADIAEMYDGGSLWSRMAIGQGPPTWRELDFGGTVDTQFRTWMVPEPGTAILAAVGLGALLRRRCGA